jgi:hypothetical protein
MDLKEMGYEGVDWINLAQDKTSGWLLWTATCQNYEVNEKNSAAWSQTAQADKQLTKASNRPYLQPA